MKNCVASVKEYIGRVVAGTGVVCVTAVMAFALTHAAKAGDWSPAQIAKYRTAAQTGDADAQWMLGYAYAYGKGVPKDDAQAVKWYHRAVQQDYAKAQNNLGAMYASGDGVPEDDSTAVKWYTKAAEQGDALGQYNLGTMYANGEGVPKDNVRAYLWFNLAATQGHAGAKENKNRLEEDMTPADTSRAQTLSRKCLEKSYKDCG